MGKGGGGTSTGSTNVNPVPWLFNQNPANQPSVMEGLTDLSQGEQAFLNEPGVPGTGQSALSSLADTGINQALYGIYTPGGGSYSPYQAEGQSIQNLSGLAPQYQNLIDQALGLEQYGQGQMQAGYGQVQNYANQVAQQQAGVTQAQQQVTNLEQGTGLYPSQQAYVNQAVQSGQAAVQQQLASEGLTSSTQNAMLQNQVAQSGAATAGQLTQGNIQLAQSGVGLQQQNVALAQQEQALALQGVQLAQGLTTGEQALSAGNLQALGSMWSSVAQQYGGMNTQAFQDAASGVGVLGGFYNQIGETYGVQLKGLQLQLEQEFDQAQVNAGLQEAEIKASSQGKSTMTSGLGSLLGKSGSGGGGSSGGILGALGGIGGLFSGGSAALGAGGAAAGSASALAAGGTAAGLGESLGALAAGLACVVAREVYGADNPKWLEFRVWFLANAPKWFVRIYMAHGYKVAAFIHDKPILKKIIRSMMDFCLR